jgi:type IV pilus assembly protein PilQ
LRPYISSDGLIRMEVHPELSEGEVVVQGGFTLPKKTLTEVTTNVMCPNGCTVILGGLMRENLKSQTTQVPLLGSLPLAGPLFRSKNETIERTEIIVLLTPRIVEQDELGEEGAQHKKDVFNMEGDKFHRMSPVSKVHLGRDYLIRAQSALARGERDKAQRFARLAVHYDPLNRDAVRFYHDIADHIRHAGRPSQMVSQGWGVETYVGDEMPVPPNVDGEAVPSWMLDDLGEGPPPPPAFPLYPRDPGMPGRDVEIVRPEAFRHD